jgi:hypothetical protein
MADDKKTESIKVWLSEPLELELRRMADADSRKLSEYIGIVLRRHVWGHSASGAADSEGAIRPAAGHD